MKISVHIEAGIVRVVQSGEFDVESYIDALASAVMLPDHRPGMPVISDVSAITKNASVGDLDRIRDALSGGRLKDLRPRRYALVSPSAIFSVMAKLYSEMVVEAAPSVAGMVDIRRFSTTEEAEAWVRGAP
ncbi:MAG: STAS/SEC14 domain-containing protein [Proteobacteria bacterium]|nr:STAS/SEC14 domain-containing protein [Pseudomonadota bacterium]